MSKYDVTYSCGHDGTVNLYGKYADRERKLEWYKTEAVCPECYKAQLAAERDAANAAAAEANAEAGLPELTGSEKQIAWAESIRTEAAKAAADTVRIATKSASQLGDDAITAEFNAACKKVTGEIMSNPSAKWWIDNRNKIVSTFNLKKIACEARKISPKFDAKIEQIKAEQGR